MIFEEPFVAAVQECVTPSEADVLVARGVVLDAVAATSMPISTTEFEGLWLASNGIKRPEPRSTFTAVAANEPGRRLADPVASDPHLAEVRARHAVRWALAQLVAEGVLTRGPGGTHAPQPEHIGVAYPGGSAGVQVLVHSPLIGDQSSGARFMAVHGHQARGSEVLLPVEELLADLDDILGDRGMTMVRESRRALRSGLYLASSSLLAAASEAAWFNLARAVPTPSRALTQRIEGGRDVAEVIRLTEQKLRDLKPSPGATVTDVVAQAHMFRELRNYALHPVEEHDGDRETWLTETGSTLLAVAVRRYFVKLAELQVRLKDCVEAAAAD